MAYFYVLLLTFLFSFGVTMIQSSSVILTLLWAVLIYHEPVTRFIVAGTCLFLCRMLLINLKIGRSHA